MIVAVYVQVVNPVIQLTLIKTVQVYVLEIHL